MASIVIDSTTDPELFATVLGLLSGGKPESAEAVEAPKLRCKKEQPEPAKSADDELKELTEAVVGRLSVQANVPVSEIVEQLVESVEADIRLGYKVEEAVETLKILKGFIR